MRKKVILLLVVLMMVSLTACKSDNYKEAMELYEEAIKMDPEDEILGEIRRIYLT